jgi:predicted alpha/beta hydrolase family esterase
MVHILLIQGAGVGGSDKLVADMQPLLQPGETLDAPVMPMADDPSASRWLRAIGKALAAQKEPFVAVGHSLGGSSLLQWLGEHDAPDTLRAVITIAAPYWGDGGWQAGEFSLPEGAVENLAQLPHIHLMLGSDDEVVQRPHLGLYGRMLPMASTELIEGMDHEWATGGAILLDRVRRYA